MDQEGSSLVSITIFSVICCSLCLYIYRSLFSHKQESSTEDVASDGEPQTEESEEEEETRTQQKSSKHKLTKRALKPQKHIFSSPDLLTTFKGHIAPITSGAMSLNEKGLVTASKDRTVFFYNLHDAYNKGLPSMQGCRTNLPYDNIEKMCWSPDFSAVVVLMEDSRSLDVMRGTKKPDGTLSNLAVVRQFENKFNEPLVGLSVAQNGQFIMTCDCSNHLRLWDLKGTLITSVNTNQGHTIHSTVSIDSKFIATSGFTPDVMVFEVIYDKSDAVQEMKKVFELVGHNSRIFCSDFSTDNSKMATVSKDGTWKLYDINVDYKQKQGPRLLVTGDILEARQVTDKTPCLVRLSPDQRIVLVAVRNSLYCYSADTGAMVHAISNIYAGPIVDVFYDAGGRFLVTLGDQYAHLFHNVAGYVATIKNLEVSLKEATYSGMKDRIKSQLDAAKKALRRVHEHSNRTDTDGKKKK